MMVNAWIADLSPEEIQVKGKDIPYDTPDFFFAIWLREVDLLITQVGTMESRAELDDWDWYEAYQQDRAPEEAFSQYLHDQSTQVLRAFEDLLSV